MVTRDRADTTSSDKSPSVYRFRADYAIRKLPWAPLPSSRRVQTGCPAWTRSALCADHSGNDTRPQVRSHGQLAGKSSKRNAEYRITPRELGGAVSRRASARANSALSGGLCRDPCEGPSRGRPLQLAANLVVAPGGRPSCPQRQPRRRSGLCRVAQLRDPCDCWFPRVLDVFTRGYPVLGTTFLTPISG